METLHLIATLYIWFAVAALIVVLNRISRFFQITSGRRSYYELFWVPLIFITIGGIRYALVGDIAGDPVGDTLMLVGGLTLMGLCAYLLRLMTGNRT
ncbi:MAG: hypothetical protein U0559_12605 [Anaerolineae bacterium]